MIVRTFLHRENEWCFYFILLGHFTLFTTGCSQLYYGFQAVGEESCYTLAYPEQQECLDQLTIGYDEYEKERQQSKKMQDPVFLRGDDY